MNLDHLKMCHGAVPTHQTGYSCARCRRTYCMTCDRASNVEMIKTIVRYCPDWRCQREKQLEETGIENRDRDALRCAQSVFDSGVSWDSADVDKALEKLANAVIELNARYGWNPSDGDGEMVAKKILTSGVMTGEDVGRICRAHLEQRAAIREYDELSIKPELMLDFDYKRRDELRKELGL